MGTLTRTGAFKQVLINAGYEPRAYSGRGMCGTSCVAIVPDDNAIEIGYKVHEALCAHDMPTAWQEVFDGEFIDLLVRYRTDNLGHRTVFYWPGVEWEQE